MFDKVFRTVFRFLPARDGHLSGRQLADLFCREVPLLESWAMRRHLAGCSVCRMRKQQLEGPCAEHMLDVYRESIENPDMVLSEWRRTAFSMHLEFQHLHDFPSPKWSFSVRGSWLSKLSRPAPFALTGALAGLVAGVAVFTFLSWEHGPTITANALLVHAEMWDAPSATARAAVVRQTVQIKSSKQIIKRSVYWDVEGKRHPEPVVLSASEERLRSALGKAGIDWDRPISASAYQDWHDHQHVRTDHIARSGAHLLTLTTTIPDGIVSAESLTVRDTDFHPVQRRVDFRDHEMVEVAELDFAVLPWTAVDGSVFDRGEGSSNPPALSVPGIARPWHGPDIPTDEQLDEAELSARLILNQRQADSGEQIEIHRLPQAIEVNGLVETDERRRELTAELMTVPRLKISIQSVAHLNENPGPASEGQTVQIESTVLADQPSPLEVYLHAHGRTLDDMNALSGEIFNNALAISQESNAIADLKTRFSPDQHMPLLTSATLAELLYSHRERLEDALHQERSLLSDVKSNNAIAHGATANYGQAHGQSTSVTGSLKDEAFLNLTLARELTQTGALNPRRAEAIFAEMSAKIDRIADAANNAYRLSHGSENPR